MPVVPLSVEMVRRCLAGLLMVALSGLGPAIARDLKGHGGPVRAIALSRDGSLAITGSFDSTAIIWSLTTGAARQVLRGHQGAVNAVAVLPDGRIASGGEDGRIALWTMGRPQPDRVLDGHSGMVAALAVAPDGLQLASAGWDGRVRLWATDGNEKQVLDDHRANVTGVGFFSNGRIVSVAADGALRVFSPDGVLLRLAQTGVPATHLVITQGDECVVAAVDGRVRFFDADGGERGAVEVAAAPIVTLAVSPDGRMLAAAGFRGALALIDRTGHQMVRRLEGPAFPLWSLAFSPDGQHILTGGADRMVRRWSVATGEPVSPVIDDGEADIPERLRHHPGAEIFRACSACHALTPDGGNRAGPTLAGLYGRKIGTAPGYLYSDGLAALPITWSKETLQLLFELGPTRFTPGSKMPEQTIARMEDRQALAEFLDLVPSR